jgi:hypothetical protein
MTKSTTGMFFPLPPSSQLYRRHSPGQLSSRMLSNQTNDRIAFAIERIARKKSMWLVLMFTIPLILNAVFCVLFANGYQIEQENGLMEDLQALFLLTAACIFFRLSGGVIGGARVLDAALGLFLFTLAVREVDVRPYNIPWLTMLLSGWIRNTTLALLWATATVWFLRNSRCTWAAFVQWVNTTAGRLFLAASIPLIAAIVIDKKHLFSKATNVFTEELLELNGYWVLLVAAALIHLQLRRATEISAKTAVRSMQHERG